MGREGDGEEPPTTDGSASGDDRGAGGGGSDAAGSDAPGFARDDSDTAGLDGPGVDAGATLAPEVAHDAGPRADTPPTVAVDGYDRIELIGRGGFATVWRARQITMDRVVALKVMDHHLSDAEAERRFRLEAAALVELSWNAHIVHVYDTGVAEDGRPYLAMEYLPEGTLGDRVRAEGPLPPDEVRRIGIALSDAVGAAHEAGVLHRDLKPDNVLLGRGGEAKLADFGIARIAGESVTSTSNAQAFRGTIMHAAPELLDSEQPTEATDIWSIGSTLYTLCTGHPPFARGTTGEDSVTAVIRRTLLDDPPSLPSDVPADLAATILSCLAKDPADRPPSVATLHARLEAAGDEGSAGGSTPPGLTPRRDGRERSGARSALLAVAAVAVVLALVGAWQLTRDDDRDRDDRTTTATDDDSDDAEAADDGLSPEEREAILARPEGISDLRALSSEGLADTSGALHDRLNRFAASTDSPVVRHSTAHQPLDGAALDFGTLPAQMDFTATNELSNRACYRVYLEDRVVLGAAGGVWTDGVKGMLIVAVQLDSPEAARQYYWATAMFHGLADGQCSGWPDDGLAIRPEALEVDRRQFDIEATPDQLLTAIDDDLQLGPLKFAIAYQSVSLIDDTVLVASVGTSATADPDELTRTVDDAVHAFTR